MGIPANLKPAKGIKPARSAGQIAKATTYQTWESLREKASQKASDYVILSSNAKVEKGEKLGYLTTCIHLSPGTESVEFGGINMCMKASAFCGSGCLNKSGMHQMATHLHKRVALTLWFLMDRSSFMARLLAELRSFATKARKKGLLPAIRPNGLSDRRDLAYAIAKACQEDVQLSDVAIYDYTKLDLFKAPTFLPSNYHLTFSRAEDNWPACLRALSLGYNVAIVFEGALPKTFSGFDVVNGDESDVRFIERTERPVIVGLSFKGSKARLELALESGFCVSLSDNLRNVA